MLCVPRCAALFVLQLLAIGLLMSSIAEAKHIPRSFTPLTPAFQPTIQTHYRWPPAPAPFNETGGVTIITGAIIFPNNVNAAGGTSCVTAPLYGFDIIISGNKILHLLPNAKTNTFIQTMRDSNILVKQIDGKGHYVIPGLIDVHVHVTGSGGEQGAHSRTPEAHLSQLIGAGLTTVIGLLGTDGVSRSLPNLMQKLKSLETDGLTTYAWTGNYHVPVVTILQNVQQDIMLLEKVIGAGEIALSDHRSSWPTFEQLTSLISDARVGGMLTGKAGKIHFHMGNAITKLELLWKIVKETSIPITQMYPTHMTSRGLQLIDEARKWIEAGGYVDFTADAPTENSTATIDTLVAFGSSGAPMSHITVSSDAFGSSPTYDSDGNLIAYDVGSPTVTLDTIRKLVLQKGWKLEDAIQFSTCNPARYLNLVGKGFLSPESEADLLLLNSTDLTPSYVIARGRVLKTPTWIQHDRFEPNPNEQ